ncbi:hypothetical protein [Desulfoscipio gibsoniae]|uniref:hypothetical protein n=1 Tax=Desulfoscipio gibsoniae TaxID=102134 RepID=UPI0002DAC36C|nr:hypothetical protein [Desulfoscipio gibsoniae]
MKEMDREQFRQITVWLRNVIKRKLPGSLQKEIERILDETEPREVEKMITNIERTLDEMQRAAEARGMEKGIKEGQTRGKLEGKLEGKIEVVKIALKRASL